MLIYNRGEYQVFMLEVKRCHCYVVSYGDKNILVDTSSKISRTRVIKCLEKNGIGTLDAVFLTHSHSDHAGNAQFISEEYGCPVYIYRDGLSDVKEGFCMMPRGTARATRAISWCGEKAPSRLFERFEACPGAQAITPEVVKDYLGEGARLIHTPFHTSDSICIILDSRIGLIGDTAINSNGNKFPPFADHEEMLSKVWGTLIRSGAKAFCPSHGRPFIVEELMLAYRKEITRRTESDEEK